MKFRRVGVVLLVSCTALVFAVFAQEAKHDTRPPNPAISQSEPQKRQVVPPGTGGEAAEHAATDASLGGQLAETSREAAGEDENAQFKESASVRWIARVTGLSLKDAYWLSIALNFAIVAIVVIIVWKSRVLALFRARTVAIQKGMEEARKASEEAVRRLQEIEQRLSKLDAEIATMRSSAEADAAVEEERIRAAAEDEKRKVIEMAEQEITAAARAARRELKSYTAELAVKLAEQRIQVDPKTDQALVRTFVDQLGEPQDGSHGKETS